MLCCLQECAAEGSCSANDAQGLMDMAAEVNSAAAAATGVNQTTAATATVTQSAAAAAAGNDPWQQLVSWLIQHGAQVRCTATCRTAS
jgi:hypothetical protein